MLTIVIFILLFWTGYVQWQIANAKRNQAEKPADVGIVLGAALWNDVPSPALKERLVQGAQLYRTGMVRKLIVSGGLDGNGSILTEAEGMRRFLTAQGIPEQDVVPETHSRSTYENLLFSLEIMDKEKWKNAIIVTHHYHGARAADIASFIGMDAALSTCDSQVLHPLWHPLRETLAFTKWEWQKLFAK